MAKAAAKKQQNNRANPASQKGRPGKKGDGDRKENTKDLTASHLYTDDNPETTLHGTGFKDEAAATKTSRLMILLPAKTPKANPQLEWLHASGEPALSPCPKCSREREVVLY